MKKVAIITVNYNGCKDTIDFLESLNQLDTKGFIIKTIVVDNGSIDDSIPEIKKKFPVIDLIQTGSNLGFTGGYNKGIKHALDWGADYLLIINNDTLIDSPNLIKELVSTTQKDSYIGLVVPKIYFAKGYEYHKDLYKRGDLGKIIWYAGSRFDWDNIMSIHRGINEVDKGQYNQIQEVDFISGCCILIKKEVIQKVGFFDDYFFAYFEDSDFSQRVIRAGFKQIYNGLVDIYHKVSQTAGVGSDFSDYFITRNRLIFGFRYAKLRTKFALLRQAVGFLIHGRPMQKKGVWNFIIGKINPLSAGWRGW